MAYKLFVDFVQRLLTDLATAKPEFVAGLQEIQAILEDDNPVDKTQQKRMFQAIELSKALIAKNHKNKWSAKVIKKKKLSPKNHAENVTVLAKDLSRALMIIQSVGLTQIQTAPGDVKILLWVDDNPENNTKEVSSAMDTYGLQVVQKKSTKEAMGWLAENSHLKNASLATFRVITDFHRVDEGDRAAVSLIESMRNDGWLSPILIFCGEKQTVLDICSSHPNVFTSTSASLLNLYFETMAELSAEEAARAPVPAPSENDSIEEHPKSPKHFSGKNNTKLGSDLAQEVAKEQSPPSATAPQRPTLDHQSTEPLEPLVREEEKKKKSEAKPAATTSEPAAKQVSLMKKPESRNEEEKAASLVDDESEDLDGLFAKKKKADSAPPPKKSGSATKNSVPEPVAEPPQHAPAKLVLAFTQEDETMQIEPPKPITPPAKPKPGRLIVADDDDEEASEEVAKAPKKKSDAIVDDDAMDVDKPAALSVEASPGNCVASMKPRSVVGQLCTVVIQPRDEDDKPIGMSGLSFVVEVRGPLTLEGYVQDHGDGSYTATFFPTRPGNYVVFVRLDDCNIRNSPLRLDVMGSTPSRPNSSDSLDVSVEKKRKASDSLDTVVSSAPDSKKPKVQATKSVIDEPKKSNNSAAVKPKVLYAEDDDDEDGTIVLPPKKPVPPVKQASGEKSAQVPKRPTPKTLFDEDSSEHEKPDDNLDLLDGPTIAIGAHDHLSITPAKEAVVRKRTQVNYDSDSHEDIATLALGAAEDSRQDEDDDAGTLPLTKIHDGSDNEGDEGATLPI